MAVAGDPPIKAQPGEVVLQCRARDPLPETEAIIVVIKMSAVPTEILADEEFQRCLKDQNLLSKFQNLVEAWKRERGARSSITQAAALDSYQKIIGMGPDAVPLLIAQLKSEGDKPDQWFWALRAITTQNPVRPEDRGNFPKMARAWIEWAGA